MANHIRDIVVRDHRLDPVESEVWITVEPEERTETTRIGGRLMGPRCPYSSTVEVAYPLRPWNKEQGENDVENLTMRVIIPEASPWEPETPFLYDGPLELWRGDAKLDERRVSYGLRSLALRRKGLVLNGKPFSFRGVKVSHLDEGQARRLHDAQFNLLYAPVTGDDDALWQLADRYGFFVLGQVDAASDDRYWFVEERLNPHTCAFGWVLPQIVLEQRQLWHTAVSVLRGHRQQLLLGIKLDEPFTGVLPGEVSFVVCAEQLLPELAATKLAKIVLVTEIRENAPAERSSDNLVIGRVSKHAPS